MVGLGYTIIIVGDERRVRPTRPFRSITDARYTTPSAEACPFMESLSLNAIDQQDHSIRIALATLGDANGIRETSSDHALPSNLAIRVSALRHTNYAVLTPRM